MSYVKTYLPTLKTHVVSLKRDTKDLSRDLQRLEVRGKLLSKTLYSLYFAKWSGEMLHKTLKFAPFNPHVNKGKKG